MYKYILNFLKSSLYPISLYARQIAGTVVLLFLARYLSVYDYGLFSSYKAIAAFWLMFACLGYQEYILVSSNKVVKEVQLKIGLFLINAVLIMCCVGILSLFSTLEIKYLFILTLIRQFLDGTFFSIALPYFQASNKFNIISYVNLFYSAMVVIITAVCYVYKLSLVKFLLFSIALGLFNFIQVSYYAKINYFLVLKNIKRLIRKIDKTIFTYMGVNLLGYLYTQIPTLYISTFIFKEKAALYFAAFTFANIIFLLIGAQSQKIIPELMKCSLNKAKKILVKNSLLLTGINMVILLVFIFAGKLLLKLIYSNVYYINAYPILLILTIANFAYAIVVTTGSYITASGQQHKKLKMQAETVLLVVVLLFLLHKFEILGAAYAYLGSAIYLALRYVYKTKKLIKEKENINAGN